MVQALGGAHRELIEECFRQESLARKNEYAVVDHAEKAFWHAKRWAWMDRALVLAQRGDPS